MLTFKLNDPQAKFIMTRWKEFVMTGNIINTSIFHEWLTGK